MRRTAVCVIAAGLCLGMSTYQAFGLEGMVLRTDRAQYDYGALIIKYLSNNENKTLIPLAAGAPNWQGCWGPSFSPDGMKIAYAFNYTEIYTMNIDASNKKKICDVGGKEQYITWTADNYLWWSECDRNIYRIKADGTGGKQIMYTHTANVHNLGVSQNGSVATWTYPSWLNGGYDFVAKRYYDFSWGCHDPCSPDGTLMLFNTGTHTLAYVKRFPSGESVYEIKPAEAGVTANLHRYSHSSNDIVFYHLENVNRCYMHNLKTDAPDKGLLIGNGIAWDYYPTEIRTTGSAVIRPTTHGQSERMGISATGLKGALLINVSRLGSYSVTLMRPNGIVVRNAQYTAPGTYRLDCSLSKGSYLLDIRSGDGSHARQSVVF